MKCVECGEELMGPRGTCFCTFQDDNPQEWTAADAAAYQRYCERADFDYWHRGEK